MSGIKIDIPEGEARAVVRLPVRITDINYGNHLGNDSMVSMLHEARLQFLQQHGFTEMDADGIGLIMKDIAVNFRSESFYGDELIISIWPDQISRASFQLKYKAICHRDDGEILIAEAQTTMVCYDYTNRKVAAMPTGLKNILQ